MALCSGVMGSLQHMGLAYWCCCYNLTAQSCDGGHLPHFGHGGLGALPWVEGARRLGMVMEGEKGNEEGMEVEQHNNYDPVERAEKERLIPALTTTRSKVREKLRESPPLRGRVLEQVS